MKFPRALLIAEIGINHNGDMALAETMIRAAKDAGADAVKFQNYRTEDFLSDHSLTYTYRNQGEEITESQFAMFKRCELSGVDLARLKRACDDAGVIFFSTPTDACGVDALVELGTAYLKNGSDYLGHLPLIRHMARSGVPTILSTGMATEQEIAEAVAAYRGAGGHDLVLLACTSAYPTPPEHANLRRIPALAERFGCAAGFSDHTAGWEGAVAAVCLGACMVEKHFTTDRTLPGPDQWFSSDAAEFAELVRRVRAAETMLGVAEFRATGVETMGRESYRLSCVADRDLPAGHVLAEADIAFRRPATGLPPSQVDHLIGQRLRHPVCRGEVLSLGSISAALVCCT
jgi:N,N'-diacetyllegionaminate synthase